MGASEAAWQLRALWDAAAPKALEKAMVEVLRSAPSLSQAAARRALASMLAHALNWTFPSDEATGRLPEEHLSLIVARCMAQGEPVEATDALARAAGTVTGDADISARLRLLSDWQSARTRLGDDDLSTLRQVLQNTESADPRSIAQACLYPFPVHLPAHCTDAWSLLLYLLRRNALPNGLPPFLLFLEYLAPALKASACQALQAWTAQHARQQGLDDQLAECRSHIATTPQMSGDSGESRVMFVLLPDGLDQEYCVLQLWVQSSQKDQAPPLRDGDARVHCNDLGPIVHERLRQAMARLGRAADLTIEFWLPAALANLPVAQWCRPGPDRVWRTDYRVVVRSLDRPKTSHSSWNRWWDQIVTSAPDTCPAEPHAERLGSHGDRHDVQLLVLDSPPDREEGLQQLRAGIHSGAPAILWHRSDCSSTAFRQSVQQLIGNRPLTELPSRLGELQHSAGGVGTEAFRDLTLLWDDPTLPRPEPKALTSPDEVVAR
ncbi:hypothetical protein [Streptomyces sp. NPDC005374]|uniref:VMAP-C domain-containing protein n=1 Tax=Streptomyces sp. NPDC005374 TaxID=3364713 RepID=UPI0036BF36CC